jgi:hypothetical protein
MSSADECLGKKSGIREWRIRQGSHGRPWEETPKAETRGMVESSHVRMHLNIVLCDSGTTEGQSLWRWEQGVSLSV